MFKLAVSADLQAQSPSLKRLDTVAANWAVLSLLSERSTAPSGVQLLYRSVPAFMSLVGQVNREAMCPGYQEILD